MYYNIGFRIEPRDRTGFAHLFEHMMFQGSENLGKMEFVRLIQSNGGVLNGSTRFDFTNYFEIVPAHKLETMLWAEADRMKGLAITEENLVGTAAGLVGIVTGVCLGLFLRRTEPPPDADDATAVSAAEDSSEASSPSAHAGPSTPTAT